MRTGTIEVSGAVVFWRAAPASRDALEPGLDALALEHLLPSDRTPKATLHEALRSLYTDPMILVRPLKKRNGFTVVHERRGEGANEYLTGMSVSVEEDGSIELDVAPGTAWIAAVEYDRIAQAYKAASNVVPANNVTRLLVSALRNMSGIPLRDAGAIYWTPESQLAAWKKLAKVVEDAAVKPGDIAVYALQTTKDAGALRAVRDGIIEELNARMTEILNDVCPPDIGKGLGLKALEAREQHARHLRQVLKEYESILGETLGDVASRLDETEQVAVEARLALCALT